MQPFFSPQKNELEIYIARIDGVYELTMRLNWYFSVGSWLTLLCLCRRKLEAPHGQVHKGGRAAAPCHPWAHAVLHGLRRPCLQV